MQNQLETGLLPGGRVGFAIFVGAALSGFVVHE
jgi:hypothetical protein